MFQVYCIPSSSSLLLPLKELLFEPGSFRLIPRDFCILVVFSLT
jgi:hypothetical protein